MPNQFLDDRWVPHEEFNRLLGRIVRIMNDDAVPWKGHACRFAEVDYALRVDRLLGAGARSWGGRWNPKGLAALYGSTNNVVAMAETYGAASRYGLTPDDLMPRVFFAFSADLRKVIDLSSGHIRQRLRVSEATMVSVNWRRSRRTKREVVTQAIGRAACIAGCEGLLVPTRHGTGFPNLVLFPELPGVLDRLETIRANELHPPT